MSLYEDIQKRLTEQPKPATTPAASTGVSKVLQAKTGKAGAGSGPAASNIAEQAAQARTETQQQQISAEGQRLAAQVKDRVAALKQQKDVTIGAQDTQREVTEGALATQAVKAAESLEAREEQFRNELSSQERMTVAANNSKYKNALAEMATRRGISTEAIMQEYQQGAASLNQRKDAAELAQVLHLKALANEAYIQEITRTGKLNRLHDSGEFALESQELTLGEEISRLIDQQNWQAAYNADERAFAEATNNMDINSALQVADIATKGQILEGLVAGGGKLAANADFSSSPTSTTPSAESPNFEAGVDDAEYHSLKWEGQ